MLTSTELACTPAERGGKDRPGEQQAMVWDQYSDTREILKVQAIRITKLRASKVIYWKSKT